MFVDYQLQVLDDYKRKKAENSLSLNLSHPTPAKIKAECLAVLEKRPLKKDEKLLASFFGERETDLAYGNAIKQSEADKFKPLSNFLRESTTSTSEKNIELLAWLIDYEPRPYHHGSTMVYGIDNTDQVSEIITVDNTPQNQELDLPKKVNFRKVGMYASVSLLIIIVAFLIQHNSEAGISPPQFPITGQEQCMYWTGDHYQPVLCSQKIDKTPVYALDTTKVAQMKMIKRPDTISRKAIGHVYYAKINGKVEFYTAEGYHPVYTSKRLRPLSLYMYTKYVLDR